MGGDLPACNGYEPGRPWLRRVPTFLVVEIPRMTTPAATFIRDKPGLVLDFFLPPSKKEGEAYHLLTMGRGGPPEDLEALARIFERYPNFRWLRPPSRTGWLATYDIPSAPVDEVFKAFSRFCDEQGLAMKWGRVEEGVVYMRVLVEDESEAQHLADRFRGFLGALRLEADVDVEVESEEGLAIWLQVLKRASERTAFGS